MTTRKKRSDDKGEMTRIAQEAAKEVRPPPGVRLRPQDEVHWKNIINARLDWTDIDLAHAANLARTFSDIELNQEMLDRNGYVNVTARGEKLSAYHTAVEHLTTRALRISAKIQVHATATIGEVENNKNKNKSKQKAVKTFKDIDEDEWGDLIARPQ